MRLNVDQLRRLIEVTWKASAPERLKLPDVTVDAESSNEAGDKASNVYYTQHGMAGIDPMSISVEPMKEPESDRGPDTVPTASTSSSVYRIDNSDRKQLKALIASYNEGDSTDSIYEFLDSLGISKFDRRSITGEIEEVEYWRGRMSGSPDRNEAQGFIDAADSLEALLRRVLDGEWHVY